MSVDTMSGDSLRAAMVDPLIDDHAGKGLTMRPEVDAALEPSPAICLLRMPRLRRRTAPAPDLAAQVHRVVTGEPVPPQRLRRLVIAAVRYLLRWTTLWP